MDYALSRLSDLPEDVGRIIIEEAVSDRTPSSWKWALLSKKVKTWVEPVLYRHVLVDNKTTFAAFHSCVIRHPTKPRDFFAVHVKTLAIPRGWAHPPAQVLEVLKACKSVHTLLLRLLPNAEYAAGLHDAVSSLVPERLSIMIPTLRYHPPAVFRGLTHLELMFGQPWATSWDWKELEAMESLTHLCVRGPGNVFRSVRESGVFLAGILPLVPRSVRVIVLWVRVASLRDADELCGMDPRVIILETSGIPEYVDCAEGVVGPHVIFRGLVDLRKDWAYIPCKERDFWTQAEEKIEERRKRRVGESVRAPRTGAFLP
ncbi:hypothetical protein DFP72DRAFT_908120 [Ephemerocybe angulata]|uniref:Uncharacterized protein n=1 Tax=Ephemerocybe angulata TaxID=980116 RepID=A0A8H6HRC5_9AGAR|nr:hypothetical protein DFP72DRAFT_908120 [Tulosesus angulatus]